MSNYLLSIIIPVYNVSSYLQRCLESVVGKLGDEVEVIIVNDGSTDDSLSVINSFKSKYSRLIVYSQENKGLSAARNAGLKLASGEYIWFIDGDDYINVEEFKTILNALYSGFDRDIITFGLVEDYLYKNKKSPILTHCRNYETGKDFFSMTIADGTFRTYAWNKLFRRSLIEKNHLEFVEGLLYEDMYFILQACMKAGKVTYFPLYPYHYVQYNTQSITKQVRRKDLDVLLFINKANEYIKRDVDSLKLINRSFQILVYTWCSSCLLKKYAYLSFSNKDAAFIFKEVLRNKVFMDATQYCCVHNVGLRKTFFAILLTVSPYLYKVLLHLSLSIKRKIS